MAQPASSIITEARLPRSEILLRVEGTSIKSAACIELVRIHDLTGIKLGVSESCKLGIMY